MTPRRIVLTTWGSYGDLFPYFALALALKAMGHVPVLVTCPYYRDRVEAAGVEFRPMAPDVDPSDAALLAKVMDPVRGGEVILRELVVPHLREVFAQVTDASAGADLIVSHPVTFATPLVARASGIPWLSTVLAPASFFSITDLPLMPPRPDIARLARASSWTARAFAAIARAITARWLRPVRAYASELGLADAGHPLFEGQFSPFGTLALFSPLFGARQPDWPPDTTATGFVFHEDDTPIDDDLQAFLDAGEPPLVFTLGSSAVGAPGRFYDESLRAVARLGRRAVMLVGQEAMHQPGRSWPQGVFAAGYAPHAPLFARAAAIVHHGGVGTTAQALRSGKPMLVVPHAHDQPDNADRARRLGVARVIDARRYTAPRVERHLRALLDQTRYRARAESVGARIAAERGVDVAAGLIAQCVERNRASRGSREPVS